MTIEDMNIDVRRLTQTEIPEIKSALVAHAGLIKVNSDRLEDLYKWREHAPCSERESDFMALAARTDKLEQNEDERKKDWKSIASLVLGVLQSLLIALLLTKLGL
jgi:hypothetical protein